MSGPIDWERLSDEAFAAFLDRLELVELVGDPKVEESEKHQARRRYREDHQISERTIRNYLARYRRQGAAGLVFHHPPHDPSPRIHEPQLAAKILELIEELPSRSVPQLRRLLGAQEPFATQIAGVSDRSIYRFLQEKGLTHRERSRMLMSAPAFW